MEDIGIEVPDVVSTFSGGQDGAATRVFVALDGELAGVILCANPLRAESAEVIARLRELNKSVAIFSGDGNSVVRAAAADLDVSLAVSMPRCSLNRKRISSRRCRPAGRKLPW